MVSSDSFFPTLGVFLSTALYLAPLPPVYKAARTCSLGTFNVLPAAAMFLSTVAWVMCLAQVAASSASLHCTAEQASDLSSKRE